MTLASVKRYIGAAASRVRRAASQSVVVAAIRRRTSRMGRVAPAPDAAHSAGTSKAAWNCTRTAVGASARSSGEAGAHSPTVLLHVTSSMAIAAEAVGSKERLACRDERNQRESECDASDWQPYAAASERSLSGTSTAECRASATPAFCSSGAVA